MDILVYYDDMRKNGCIIEYRIFVSYAGIDDAVIDDSYYRISYIEKENFLIFMDGEPIEPRYLYKITVRKCPKWVVHVRTLKDRIDTVFGETDGQGLYTIEHEYRYEKFIESIPDIAW